MSGLTGTRIGFGQPCLRGYNRQPASYSLVFDISGYSIRCMTKQSSDPELDLLSEEANHSEEAASASGHALRTAPVITGDTFNEVAHSIFPQRALYGSIVSQHTRPGSQSDKVTSPKLYINTNSPFSALVCGVQGSGKSHSTAVLLENCLIRDERIGTLPAPLSALVFYFDTAAGGGAVQPCEAAYLSVLDKTKESTKPTYLNTMRKVYAGLPNVRVEPLLFSPEDISGERLLAMMKVDENGQLPLYIESILATLRGMEDAFDYLGFRKQLKSAKFNNDQRAMLDLRLSLLDSCLNGGNTSNSIKKFFKPGALTIIDLSSPFMDEISACGFFDIILGLFIEAENDTSGKVVVLDEAHKYLSESQSGSSGRLTKSLLTVVRQQRHLATRVIISTQEPTVVPAKFLDLCSFFIAHRFSSPKWFKTLAQHVSPADSSTNELFDKIVSLQTGQAILFAPGGLCVHSLQSEAEQPSTTATAVGMLGQGHLVVKSRQRLTVDGGHSLLAVTSLGMSTRLSRVSGGEQGFKMNTVTKTKMQSVSVSSSRTVTSTSVAKQVIDMNIKKHKRYSQLLEYVRGTTNVRLSAIVRHFKKKPDIYGKDENHIKDAVNTAVRLGILVQDKQRISVDNNASYSR